METKTFLNKLPAKAMSKPIVAKIKIVSSKTHDDSVSSGKVTKIIAETKVVEAIKGIEEGAALKVEVELHSCSREPEIMTSQTYYIAGAIRKDGLFRGEWKKYELDSK